MAIMPEPVYRRQLALAARYGYEPGEVAESGISSEGIRVLHSAYARELKPSRVVTYSSYSPFVDVSWATREESDAAQEAAVGDYEEMFGRSAPEAF